MKKALLLFIVIGFMIVGCSQEPNNEVKEPTSENTTATSTNEKMEVLELKEPEEIDIFTEAVNRSTKEPGIVDILVDPQYQFSIDEESYFLWITKDSGTIMNKADSHTIYSLSNTSVDEVYELLNKG